MGGIELTPQDIQVESYTNRIQNHHSCSHHCHVRLCHRQHCCYIDILCEILNFVFTTIVWVFCIFVKQSFSTDFICRFPFDQGTVKSTSIQLFDNQELTFLDNSSISQNANRCSIHTIDMRLFLSLFLIQDLSTKTSTIYGRMNMTLWSYPFFEPRSHTGNNNTVIRISIRSQVKVHAPNISILYVRHIYDWIWYMWIQRNCYYEVICLIRDIQPCADQFTRYAQILLMFHYLELVWLW